MICPVDEMTAHSSLELEPDVDADTAATAPPLLAINSATIEITSAGDGRLFSSALNAPSSGSEFD
jgi:hypothetical protein